MISKLFKKKKKKKKKREKGFVFSGGSTNEFGKRNQIVLNQSFHSGVIGMLYTVAVENKWCIYLKVAG